MTTGSITRRRAIRMVALGGLALGLGLEELRQLANTRSHLACVHETRLLMGTLATLTILSDQPDAARAAIDSAFSRMAQLEQVLSRFLPSSQVSYLNRAGAIAAATPDLQRMLTRAIDYSERTNGAFDVTVGPLLAAYRAAALQGQLPNHQALQELTTLVDYRQIRQQGDSFSLGRSGMTITLDGLAKGYILDAGADELLRLGFADVLVEAGGDLMAQGMTENNGWQIGIQSPTSATALLGTVTVENAAVATSGDYRHQFIDANHHHILDPRTGISTDGLASVTVIAPTACDADALSTALMILEPEYGLALLEQVRDSHALMVGRNGELRLSAGFPQLGGSA